MSLRQKIATIVKLQNFSNDKTKDFAAFFIGVIYMNEVYRQEKKYFMTLFDMKKLSNLLDSVMIKDLHNGTS